MTRTPAQRARARERERDRRAEQKQRIEERRAEINAAKERHDEEWRRSAPTGEAEPGDHVTFNVTVKNQAGEVEPGRHVRVEDVDGS